jgi:hypothetical protein
MPLMEARWSTYVGTKLSELSSDWSTLRTGETTNRRRGAKQKPRSAQGAEKATKQCPIPAAERIQVNRRIKIASKSSVEELDREREHGCADCSAMVTVDVAG